jgi:hypothetical protein
MKPKHSNGLVPSIRKIAASVFPSLAVVFLTMTGCSAPASVEFTAENCEIVLHEKASPVTEFAAKELSHYLSRVLGGDIPVVRAATPGKNAIVLAPTDMPRDSFSLKTSPNRLTISGKDDPGIDLEKRLLRGNEYSLYMDRGTLFGAYEFLERFAGVRFYFPGELGEIVPSRKKIVCSADEVQSPAYGMRRYSFHNDGNDRNQRWFEPGFDCRTPHVRKAKALQWIRNRMKTETGIPCCHGVRKFDIQQRFAATHPEYLALLYDPHSKKTYRDLDPKEKRHHPGQICFSSQVWDVFYQDAVKRIAAGEKYIDLMPQDGFRPCQCDSCKAMWKTGDTDYASDLLWGKTAELARRLKPHGGIVTQMSYTPYRRVPDIDLPDNIRVVVAVPGPWAMLDKTSDAEQNSLVRAWAEKTGHKSWIWTYPCKLGRLDMPRIPQMTPRAFGRYYSSLEPWITGAYAESESDTYLANYLNHYVFGKVCWNPKTDVDALLEEHYRLMFGAAWAEMKTFFENLEDKWMREVSGKTVETPLGPKTCAPPEYDLWTKVYTRRTIDGWTALLDAAASKVDGNSLEGRRVALFRREFLDPLAAECRHYLERIDVEKGLLRDRSSTRPNLIDNGSFEEAKGWSSRVGNRSFAYDSTTKVDGAASMRLWSTNRSDVVQYLDGKLKPKTKYRMSWFMKLQDVKPLSEKCGVYGEVIADAYICLPKLRAPTGTSDWIYQSYEFETPTTIGVRDKRPYFHFLIQRASGTVWFDGVRLEEIETGKQQQ